MDCFIRALKACSLFHPLTLTCCSSSKAAGGSLVYVGSYVIRSYNNFDNFLEDRFTLIPAIIIISVGVVMFAIGLVGCCATLKESKVGLSFVSSPRLQPGD